MKIAGKENAVKDVCIALKIHKVAPEVCEAGAAALVSLLLDGELTELMSRVGSDWPQTGQIWDFFIDQYILALGQICSIRDLTLRKFAI